MAHAIEHHSAPSFPLTALRSVWAMFCWFGETTARARMLRELSELSDAQLAAQGMTRQDIVRRVFDDGTYI